MNATTGLRARLVARGVAHDERGVLLEGTATVVLPKGVQTGAGASATD